MVGLAHLESCECRGRTARLSSVEPPIEVRAPAIATVSDSEEQRLCQVNTASDAAHALVADRGLNGLTCARVHDGQALAAVRIVVGRQSHELKGQRDLHVTVGVDVPSTCAETPGPIGDVSLACLIGTLTVIGGAGHVSGTGGTRKCAGGRSRDRSG